MHLPIELQLQILEAADFTQIPILLQVCTSWRNYIYTHIHSPRFLVSRYAVHPRAVKADSLPPLPGYHVGITYLTHLLLIEETYHPCHIEFYNDGEEKRGQRPKTSFLNWRIFVDDRCILPAAPGNLKSSLQTHVFTPSCSVPRKPLFTSSYTVPLELDVDAQLGRPKSGHEASTLPESNYGTIGRLFKRIVGFYNSDFIERKLDRGLELKELMRVNVECRFYPEWMTNVYIWFEEEDREIGDVKEVVRLIL
ncbi:hypothetical protein TWF506_005903 [Arthrobotrys conoides]|uniref:F-box domain-containing protein n=1 Tax=Arthrobotrys conoides TaxID=74498 RepID=A0AAN8NCV2_9PEZI